MLERYDEGLYRFLFNFWIFFGFVLFSFITDNFLPLIFIALQIIVGIFASPLNAPDLVGSENKVDFRGITASFNPI
jgi:hypothetical protein|tara:strand:- start:414 stop:641 length:228 start_codon:yes stop_codon:yes gene_type:complete